MEYFLLTISKNVKNTIKPELIDIESPLINYDTLPEVAVGYFDGSNFEKSDILKYPVLMVSQEIMNLLILYDEELEHKAVQLFTKGNNPEGYLYYAINPKAVDCLHPFVTINPNGTVNEVVLDAKRVPKDDIFLIDRLVERKIVISMRLAESLLRRKLYGIGLETIRIE